jgi:hypothetical protein
MKKKPTLKKPTLTLVDVDKFAKQAAGSPANAPQGDKTLKARVGKGKTAKKAPNAPKQVSGNVPAGDVRLSANMHQAIHLKLKIAAARERITIGEILERLVDKYLD